MRNILVLLALTVFALLSVEVFTGPIKVQSAFDSVYISEINYAGSNTANCKFCAHDKWIELYNPTSEPMNLKNWTIITNPAQPSQNITINSDQFIQPKAYFIIGTKHGSMTKVLQLAGVRVDYEDGRTDSISTKDGQTGLYTRAFVSLRNPEGVTSGPSFSSTDLNYLGHLNSPTKSEKTSVQFNFTNQKWEAAKTNYYPGHFGSPKGLVVNSSPQPKTQPDPVTSTSAVTPEPTNLNSNQATNPTPKSTIQLSNLPTKSQSVSQILTPTQTQTTPTILPNSATTPKIQNLNQIAQLNLNKITIHKFNFSISSTTKIIKSTPDQAQLTKLEPKYFSNKELHQHRHSPHLLPFSILNCLICVWLSKQKLFKLNVNLHAFGSFSLARSRNSFGIS